MAARVTLEAPSIQVNSPDTGLSVELTSEQLPPDRIFTIHSVDSSPMEMQSKFQAPTSPLLNQNEQNKSQTDHRNSLDSHRNSLTNRRASREQEERNQSKRHRGRVYRTLTLEESAYHEDYVFCSSDGESIQEPNKNSDEDRAFSESKIETKRHTYVYMHYVEQAIFLGSVILLGVLSVVLFAVGKLVLAPVSNEKSLTYTSFDPVSGNLRLSRGTHSIQCSLTSAGADPTPPVKFDEQGTSEDVRLRYSYSDSSFVLSETLRDSGVCTQLFWEASSTETLLSSLELCFSIQEGHWFGGYEGYSQQWPLDYNSTQFYKPFLSTDYISDGMEFGPVLHPAWFSSEGAAVIAETDESYLHVQLMKAGDSESQLCLRASFDGYLLSSSSAPDLTLNVSLCIFDTILQANKHFLDRVLSAGNVSESEGESLYINRLFPDPIWSTWEKYRTGVDQQDVLELLDNINEYGFNASIIQIDDKFSSYYGDLHFDETKFSNATLMVEKIHASGVNVSVWVHPFGNINSAVFQESLAPDTSDVIQDRWMFCRGDNHTLGVVRWWRGYGGLIDLTKRSTFDWFLERVKNFSRDYSIDSFKFDAGETTYLPQCDLSLHPNKYVQLYVQLASHFPGSGVQVGYDTQVFPTIVSLLDRESKWGLDNGLHSILTSTLTLSILGYPFVLPGTIGGSNYKRDVLANSDQTSNPVDAELFTRWVGVNAFLPFMQFSHLPWLYEDNVLQYSISMTALHSQLVTGTMDCLARQFMSNHEPIIRPLWWGWPLDSRVYTINTQFLIGDVYLVAPALFKAQSSCLVYFPANSGPWRDARNGTTYPVVGEAGREMNVSCLLYETPPYFKNTNSQLNCV